MILACATIMSYTQDVLSKARVCSKKEAQDAEVIVSTAKTWGQSYQQFKRYAHCDDGAIGEGFSESISILLAEHWEDIAQLGKISRLNPAFLKFVIKHIDETLPADRLERIAKNAGTQCPLSLKKLCRDIKTAAST